MPRARLLPQHADRRRDRWRSASATTCRRPSAAKPTRSRQGRPATSHGRAAGEAEGRAKSQLWAASAPGRVEPIGGEVRIGAQVPGRIAEVLVPLNDKVAAGDLLVRLDDEELHRPAERRRSPRRPCASASATMPRRPASRPRIAASAEDAVANCRASAGAGPRGARSRYSKPPWRATGDEPTSTRRAPRCAAAKDKAAGAGARQPAQGAGRRRPAGADPARSRRWSPRAPSCRWSTRRSSARASGRHPTAPSCRSTPRLGETVAPSPETCCSSYRRSVRAAGAGRDRGARHRQGARRPEAR